MLGKKAENKYYMSRLVQCLDYRLAQMQQLHFLNKGKNDLTLNFSAYNNHLLNIKTHFGKEPFERGNEVAEFIAPYRKLRVAAKSLKKYEQAMMFYQNLSFIEFRELLQESQMLEKKNPGALSLNQIKRLQHNKEFFLGKNFYDILQTRLAVQAFLKHLKTELRNEVERYHWSLLKRMYAVTKDPFHLWSMKGWRLLAQKESAEKQLLDDTLRLSNLCDKVLELNATQFQYYWQAALLEEPLSQREQTSIKSLLLDPSIQKQMLSMGVINQSDIQTLSLNWQAVFNKVNRKKVVLHKVTVNETAKQRVSNKETVSTDCVAVFLDKIKALTDANAAFRHYGLSDSLLNGHIRSSKAKWGVSFSAQKRQQALYQGAIEDLHHSAIDFFAVTTSQSMKCEDVKSVLRLIDKLTQMSQSCEGSLMGTKIGDNFLDVIDRMQQMLFHFQASKTHLFTAKTTKRNYSFMS